MLIEILIASFVVMLAALGGALSFFKTIGNFIERNLGLLISFTAGLFLYISYELGKEAILHSPAIEEGLLWILGGAVLIWVIFKVLPHSHECKNNSQEENCEPIDIRKVLTGNGIHNIGDGVLLAAAFSVSFPLGLFTTMSVFVHELVQETSIFFILRRVGYTIKQGVLINFAVSGTILIGSVGGALLLSTFAALEAPLLGISAGAFFVVVLQDLIPHSLHESHKDKKCFPYHIICFLLGFLLMLSISIAIPHSHEHHEHNGDHDHHEEEHHHHHE